MHRTSSTTRLQFSILTLFLATSGCAALNFNGDRRDQPTSPPEKLTVNVEQAHLFRQAETERAAQLTREIARLQADLKTAEAALVEAESGLAGSHTRADAVSSLATTRIQIERAALQAPWRSDEIAKARAKLEQAEKQVAENRFGAALFFVYRARRVAESILDEAEVVARNGSARLIRSARVNLRAGPSTTESILAVLTVGTPVFLQGDEGEWVLVQVSGGPAGWINRRLLGDRITIDQRNPAAPRP